jgi:methionyl-tRNA formyltransferase
MLMMRIVFMGTPHAAVPTLRQCLDDGHEVVAVWTQPDRPSGRGNKITFSPVKEFAISQGLNVFQPARIKNHEAKQLFASHDADVAVVVAYGKILPDEFLKAPRRGCINVHFSLLPLYRGAAPANWAIINGETKTGVTTMFIEPTLDTGPILLQSETPVGGSETAPELMERLAEIGASLLGETLSRLDEITPRPQRDQDATFAPILKKEDGLIDWSQSASAIERRVRGLQPWPAAYTIFKSKRVTIWDAAPIAQFPHIDPPQGEVLSTFAKHLTVGCGEKTQLRINEVQVEGGRRMTGRDFINGMHVVKGDRFG